MVVSPTQLAAAAAKVTVAATEALE